MRMRTLWLWALGLGLSGGLPAQTPTPAESAEAAVQARIARYVGRHEVQRLLREPAVQRGLRALAGPQAATLERALGVAGAVDFIDGWLAASGNAPHQGGELEAVVCVSPDEPTQVLAALLEQGKVTVFAPQSRWDYLPLCVRDWAALAAQGRQARIRAPANVRLISR